MPDYMPGYAQYSNLDRSSFVSSCIKLFLCCLAVQVRVTNFYQASAFFTGIDADVAKCTSNKMILVFFCHVRYATI